jgi:superfamily II DNA or RNA helicase
MLRSWQQAACAAYRQAQAQDWLLEATPGAGKTVVALTLAREWLATGAVQRVAVICPTAHLRRQWAEAAARLGLALDPTPRQDGREGADYHGAIYTYQLVASAPGRYAALHQAQPTGIILDEIHHAGDGLAWGEALRVACAAARRRLALSGTPFRSDDAGIPFVRYGPDGLSVPDFRYGYEAAIRDGVCRPLVFLAYGGQVSWRRGSGPICTATFDQSLMESAARDRLRAAVLSPDWLETVLLAAHRLLTALRGADPTAGGLVVASSQDHARRIADHLTRLTGETPALAVSDDPVASATIRRFRDAARPWLVAVNMVSEGVDLPRLRVGVYATTVQTRLYFRQVAGRLVRRRPADSVQDRAWLFLPSDPTLLAFARQLEAAQRRALAEAQPEAHTSARRAGAPAATTFEALGGIARPQTLIMPVAPTPPTPAPPEPIPRFVQRERLRARHQQLVRLVARRYGVAHRYLHTELARRTGSRIEDADLQQLAARLELLHAWLTQGLDLPAADPTAQL